MEPVASDLLPEDAYDGSDPFFERFSVIERAVASWKKDSDNESKRLRRQPLLRMLEKLRHDPESPPFLSNLATLDAQIEGD